MNRLMTAAVLAFAVFLASCSSNQRDPGGLPDGELSNKDVVRKVIKDGLGRGDLDVIREYVAEDYIQHNPNAADGRQGLIDYLNNRDTSKKVEYISRRLFQEGEYVWAHSELVGDGVRTAVMDLWRVKEGQLVEHWDAMQPQPEKTASGRSMLDGPTDIGDRHKRDANKKLVREFVEAVLVRRDLDRINDYIEGDYYHQHNPGAPDGPEALRSFLQGMKDSGLKFSYEIKRVVAEGNFVLVQALGNADGQPLAIYDLFRCENGKVAEHWDVIQPIPESTRSGHGMVD
ncbi:MAG: nuclear transport factor 2 family protein [Planctomycetes bacterium]|nr:nuclear transport factor 2 family protein [Planctomycetota bacterium]